jgi:exopolyphosphatase / guanosine-5'-triphosphate,3'-diphosphate pyrophosphatase
MTTDPTPPSPPLAALDLGSNSFRLEIARFHDGSYEPLGYHKQIVRLGADLDADRRLSESGIQRALQCLAEFNRALGPLPTQRVRAVATQTLRDAVNRDEVLARAQQALGHPVEVISGHEEARLIFAGVSGLQPSDKRRLVIDIGGRSTELVIGEGAVPQTVASCELGSVSLSMRCFRDGQLSAEAFAAAQAAAAATLEPVSGDFNADAWQEALGASGTVGAVAEILEGTGVTDGRITPDALRHLRQQAIQAGHVDRLQLPGITDARRSVLPGGLAILCAVVDRFGITELLPAQGALRQGVVIDLHGRLSAHPG